MTQKWSRKTPRAILYNLRYKPGAKINYGQSYSNSTAQITPCSDPPCIYILKYYLSIRMRYLFGIPPTPEMAFYTTFLIFAKNRNPPKALI